MPSIQSKTRRLRREDTRPQYIATKGRKVEHSYAESWEEWWPTFLIAAECM